MKHCVAARAGALVERRIAPYSEASTVARLLFCGSDPLEVLFPACVVWMTVLISMMLASGVPLACHYFESWA